ncbi:MAG: transketolase [Proteobacteria bacterium]|nr:transketolase [Pseudomonadota bacterium]MDA0959460.1 transketolase [Pseudomonadota bacterium]MDA1152832.1 transketolase [Pseudomonadota bacterium]
MPNSSKRQTMANAIRALTMDAVQAANSGHPGMPMGMADAATALFCDHMKFDAASPNWPDRDRFVLSAGHGSMLIYALLHLTGYQDMTIDEIRNFRQLGARTAGHPEFGHADGIETTTGPLGQGIANAVGMAMAERHLAAHYGDDLVDHHTYVIAGDGCLMEGVSHEAASMAGHMKLGRLIVLFDDNSISIDGSTNLATSDDTVGRFAAYGWQVLSCDGHDMDAVSAAISAAKDDNRPSLICCKTIIGLGAPNKQGTSGVHGAPLGDAEIALAREHLGWTNPAFEIPADILAAWRAVGANGARAHKAWQDRHAASQHRTAFDAAIKNDFDQPVAAAVLAWKEALASNPQKLATRVASQKAIEAIFPVCPTLFGGSADLTGSNNTRVADHSIFNHGNYGGTYIHYGVREHGMAAAMNGIALHGGAIPYGGTFMVFTDYCRPSIRLSALMGQRVIYVMTHDSIGLGEDGPTHQPVEHLAALRAIPNLLTFRPGDAVETAEAWQTALEAKTTPSILALSRQGLGQFRSGDMRENKTAKGGYVAADCNGTRQITLMASGSEVGIIIAAQKMLADSGIQAAVVSMPCLDLFAMQDAGYRKDVLGTAPRIAVEAGLRQSWDWLLGENDHFIGMSGFGASAPIDDLYNHFGITAEAVVAAAKSQIA